MQETHYISSEILDLHSVQVIIEGHKTLALSEEAQLNIKKSREYLVYKMKDNETPVYGINTGFGSLCNVKISSENLSKLQENLVMSHACGTGELVPKPIVKLMLLLKIQSLSYGYSGVQIETVERLIDFYNNDILPVIYSQGSLGASGDLAPLAHLSLPLLGKGEVYYGGDRISSEKMLKKFNWEPITLMAKEGLALLNGTQFMGAYGVYCLLKSYKLSYLADLIGAISIDAFDCNMSPFNAFLFIQGLETLHLRIQRHVENALAVARFLEGHPAVSWVSYPGLASHPSHDTASRYLDGGFGGVLTFGVLGGEENARRVIEASRLFSLVANVGDTKSLIIHPWSTTHEQLSVADRNAAGVTDDLIRLSIGIEDADDLIRDLDAALRTAVGL